MKQHIFIRLLSLMLASVMVLGLIPGASAASSEVQWKKSRTELIPDRSDRLVTDQIHTPDPYKPTDLVRVSIVLEDTPTLKAGYSTQDIAHNGDARAYDLALKQAQADMADAIGHTEEAAHYRALYEQEKKIFQERYVNEDGSLIRHEQTAALYALFLDLLPL